MDGRIQEFGEYIFKNLSNFNIWNLNFNTLIALLHLFLLAYLEMINFFTPHLSYLLVYCDFFLSQSIPPPAL